MDSKAIFKNAVFTALNDFINEKNPGTAILEENISVLPPPDSSMGDFGVPMFPFAKILKIPPQKIAEEVSERIGKIEIGQVVCAGAYVNIRLEKTSQAFLILNKIQEQGDDYGSFLENGSKPLEGRRVMVEYSSPNTNKPLHLGHMRNDALGESVSRILKKAGAEVFKVNIINNRGIHICKSMIAYKLFHEQKGETPQTLNIKGDHFVGQCYVEYDKYSKEHPEVHEMAENLLRKWEDGDEETRKLWKTMNDWAISGMKVTYERTGVSFDKLYYESETYLKGKEEILKGLEKGIFFKAEDGSIRIDVSEITGNKDEREHEKVLLRKDGTSVYITQDIGTAISRHDDWPFNQLIYVVASEQIYHFKVLFYILKKLGFEWTDKLYHLSYGLVNLPNGRMKSREGTVVDADDLIDSLHFDALNEIKAKGRDKEVGNADEVAEKVALAALHYYLLQITPVKDMVFNPEESLSFNGNTGPYLQYMGARINSILAKAGENGIKINSSKEAISLLDSKEEWELIKQLGEYPKIVEISAENQDPSRMANYLYETAKLFSKFYQQCPIVSVNSQNENLSGARLFLAKCTLTVIKSAMNLVLVPYLEKM